MIEIPLDEYVTPRGNASQAAAAKLVGCTDGAIWQAIRDRRQVFLVFDDDGTFVRSYEITKYPRRQSA